MSSLREELRELIALAAPVAAAQMGMMLLGVVDTIMVGHLSKEALASVALGNMYVWGMMIVGHGILLALDPVISQAHGAGDRPMIALSLQRGLVLSQVLALPFAVPFLGAAPILRLLGQPPEIIPDAALYIRNIWPGLPAFFAFIVLRQSLQAMSVVRPVLLAVLVGNLLNVVLNYGFIFGHFGLPALGASGTAWSTSIGRWVMLLVVALDGRAVLADAWTRPTRALFSIAAYRRLIAIGFPTGIQYGLEVWVFMTAALVMGTLGTVPLAGHQIAINLASLSFMLPLGIGAAAATRVGNAVGRGDASGARRAARVSLMVGAAVMTGSALAFGLLPRALARLYTDDAQVIAQAAALLPIAALFQIFDGTQAVGCGVLRGVADTRAAAIINLVGYWVVGLPLGLWLGLRRGMGPRGIWWGLTAGLILVALLLLERIRRRFARDQALTRVEA